MHTLSEKYLQEYNVELTGEFRRPHAGELVPAYAAEDRPLENKEPITVPEDCMHFTTKRWILRTKPSTERLNELKVELTDGICRTWGETVTNFQYSSCVSFQNGNWDTFSSNSMWTPDIGTGTESNSAPTYLIRKIVPKKTLVPWTLETCPENLWFCCKANDNTGYSKPIHIEKTGIWFVDHNNPFLTLKFIKFSELAENFVQRNGNPCGEMK